MQIIEVTAGKLYHIYVKTSSQKFKKKIKFNINGNVELEICGKRKKENEFGVQLINNRQIYLYQIMHCN